MDNVFGHVAAESSFMWYEKKTPLLLYYIINTGIPVHAIYKHIEVT